MGYDTPLFPSSSCCWPAARRPHKRPHYRDSISTDDFFSQRQAHSFKLLYLAIICLPLPHLLSPFLHLYAGDEDSKSPKRLDPSRVRMVATIVGDNSVSSSSTKGAIPPPKPLPKERISHSRTLSLNPSQNKFGGFVPPTEPPPPGHPASIPLSDGKELLKESVLLIVDVPSLGMSSKLRFRASSLVIAAKQVIQRRWAQDEILNLSFWCPDTGIWLHNDRTLQSYLLKNGVPLCIAGDRRRGSARSPNHLFFIYRII